MIGVVAADTERGVVSEFFELFKTPWRFEDREPDSDVLICSGQLPVISSAKLILLYSSEPTRFDKENGIEFRAQQSTILLSFKGQIFPIYGKSLLFENSVIHSLSGAALPKPAAVEISSGNQTIIRIGFDLFAEIDHLLRYGQPSRFAAIATLDLHIALIRDLIVSHSLVLVEIPPVPVGYNFIACLTHDVDHMGIRNYGFDHTFVGFLYRAIVGSLVDYCRGRRPVRHLLRNWRAALSLPLVRLGVAEDFWDGFDRYLEIETGLPSTFFVIPTKSDPGRLGNGQAPSRRAAGYEVSEISRRHLESLVSAGCEIGVHGIDGWCDPAMARAEFDRVYQVTGHPNMGMRIHWLFFGESSARILEDAGFAYDSTAGYNETIGYYAGTTQVFKPLSASKMLELPMHIMDTALFFSEALNLSFTEARAAIGPLLQNASRLGGVLTINWHDRSLAPERLWEDFYLELLQTLKKSRPWFATASDAVAWFRKRRSAVIKNVVEEDGSIRVTASVKQPDERLPGLRLRVHRPMTNNLASQPAASQFTDVVFDDAVEIEVPVYQTAVA